MLEILMNIFAQLHGTRIVKSGFQLAFTGIFALCVAAVGHAQEKNNTSAAQGKTILFIGDSLTAGYGVKKEDSFPEKVGEKLRAKGKEVKVINGGISGSVTAEADRRIKWFLKAKPDVLVLGLGGNDGLKGTPPAVIKKNLSTAIDLAKANNLKVLLLGIRVYTNFGTEYAREFEKVYSELAKEKKVAFYPFLLEGVALKRELNQTDMKHPNAAGHEIIADKLTSELEKLL